MFLVSRFLIAMNHDASIKLTDMTCQQVKQDLCLPVSSLSTRAALHSAARGDLVIPRTRLRLGNRAFSVAGPAAWNSLPSDIRTASTLSAFKNRLKIHLFLQSYYVSSYST